MSDVNPEVIRADKRYRVKFLSFGIPGLLAWAALMWILGWIEEYAWNEYLEYLSSRRPPPVALLIHIQGFVLSLVFIPMGIIGRRYGRRVLSSGQLPPPGTKAIFDTRIIRGEKARTRGRLVIVLSVVQIVAGVVLALGMAGLTLWMVGPGSG